MFKQEEDIIFCDYNYTGLELVQNHYDTRQGREKIEMCYNKILTYYFGISKEYDKKAEENYLQDKLELDNKVQNINHNRRIENIDFAVNY